jgi:hypothetical protein
MVQASDMYRGSSARLRLRSLSPSSVRESCAARARELVKVLLAATAFSTPVARCRVWSEHFAMGEERSVVIAAVSAPCPRAAVITSTMSSDCPDCEMPSTSTFFNRGGFL